MTDIHTIPLHMGDLIQDTYHLSAAEFGAYVRLIVAHYRYGVDGIPDQDELLRKLAGCTGRQWPQIRPMVEPFFTLQDGVWLQKRVLQVLQAMQAKSHHNRDNALKRWKTPHATASDSQCDGNANAMQSIIHNPVSTKKEGFAFVGEVIRVTERDYAQWQKTFHTIPDLNAELRSLDSYYAVNGRDNWFYRTSQSLNREHQKRLGNQKPGTGAKANVKTV